jgi:putative CocE/NonD family hydrolase
VLDKVMDRWFHLPVATSSYTITSDVRIPARDGVDLLADVYEPTGPAAGTILVRSPYGWSPPIAAFTGGVFARRGYRVILARCRGTFGSEGTFDPMVHEIDDGADTVAWMREQPWFDGRFATYGASYLGFTQWALLMDPPPELVTSVVLVGPHDFRSAVYPGGAFALNDFLGWSNQTSRQEEHGAIRTFMSQLGGGKALATATGELPLVDAGERLLDGRASWYRGWVARRDAEDPFWARVQLADALERVQAPVLLQTGWQDLFLEQSLEQYARLSARGVDVGLTVGPWTHISLLTKGGPRILTEALDWFGEHLGGSGLRTRAKPVSVFVTGADQWRDLAAWPPPTEARVLHLQLGGGLGDEPAPLGSVASFTYDPADPTPSIGGRLLDAKEGGYKDDRALGERSDVASFTGAPLTAPLDVIGTPVLELAHASDNPHADVFARLSEVQPDGSSQNVSEGFVRLDPGSTDATVRLELDAIAHRFSAGSRIRVVVAGGSHPRWERNLGTGDDPATSSGMAPSKRTIDLATSQLRLPVDG